MDRREMRNEPIIKTNLRKKTELNRSENANECRNQKEKTNHQIRVKGKERKKSVY